MPLIPRAAAGDASGDGGSSSKGGEERSDAFDDFLRHLWSDLDRGRALPVQNYVARYPAIAARIEAEYASLVRDPASPEAGGVGIVGGLPGSERTIGRYEVLRLIGRGGMGEVHLAWDPELRRRVVLKTLSGLFGKDAKSLERMRREAQIASRIAHEGVCSVLDVIVEEQGVVIVLPHIEGETLAALLGRARARREEGAADPFPSLPRPERSADSQPASAGESSAAVRGETRGDLRHLLRFMEEVAAAVHEMHDSGVVHRDLKPGNLMIRADGQPVVLDFGLAVDQTSRALRLTAPGEVLGTPLYMAPEQIEGRLDRIDRRTDVHALGAILFELLTLRSPFEAPTKQAVLKRICSEDPPSPRSLNPHVPADLDAVCLKALAFEPERRYASAAAFAQDLRNVRTLQPTVARPLTPAGRLMRRVQRAPWTWSFALAAVVAASAGAVIVRSLRRDLVAASEAGEIFALMDARLRGEPPTEEQMTALRKLLDPVAADLYVANPMSPGLLAQLAKSIADRSRSADETELRIQPHATLSTARPLFEFRSWQKQPVHYELNLQRDSSTVVDGFPVTVTPVDGRVRFELPAGRELAPGNYRWSVSTSATAAREWVEFRVAAPDEIAALLDLRSTGDAELDRLLRATVLLQKDFAQDAAALLDQSTSATSDAVEAWRLLLRARAAARMQDMDGFLSLEAALQELRRKLDRRHG